MNKTLSLTIPEEEMEDLESVLWGYLCHMEFNGYGDNVIHTVEGLHARVKAVMEAEAAKQENQ